MEKVTISCLENRSSSIRLGINVGLFSKFQYLHLPPLHKLIDKINIDLSVGSTHAVSYQKLGVENMITLIDNHDMEIYWNFLTAERIIDNMITKLSDDQTIFQMLQIKFQHYHIDLPVKIEEYGKLLLINSNKDICQAIVIDMLKRLQKNWFYRSTCDNSHCIGELQILQNNLTLVKLFGNQLSRMRRLCSSCLLQ